VGAPCGCIGCFDDLDDIQGNWTYSRKNRVGNFHAMQYDSLVCGCDDGSGNPLSLVDGKLCGNRDLGPTPPAAPANVACFTGVGELSPINAGKRTQVVGFRVEVQDRGEPGTGKNSGSLDDVYRIRIWIPGTGETAEGLAQAACCENPTPSLRAPDIDDGGTLIHGNIQIHPELPKTLQGICPPPNGTCND
jgi:hypothetical protein